MKVWSVCVCAYMFKSKMNNLNMVSLDLQRMGDIFSYGYMETTYDKGSGCIQRTFHIVWYDGGTGKKTAQQSKDGVCKTE